MVSDRTVDVLMSSVSSYHLSEQVVVR